MLCLSELFISSSRSPSSLDFLGPKKFDEQFRAIGHRIASESL